MAAGRDADFMLWGFGTPFGTPKLATPLRVFVTVRGPAKRCDWLVNLLSLVFLKQKTCIFVFSKQDQWCNLGRWVYVRVVWPIKPVFVCLRLIFFAILLQKKNLRCHQLLVIFFG